MYNLLLVRSLTIGVMLAGVACAAAGRLYFPSTDDRWERIDGANALREALDFAGARRSTAVVVLYRGKLMAEKQWDPAKQKTSAQWDFARAADGQTIEDVASAQKSVTAVLFGIAQQKGLIHLDDPAAKYLGEGWTKTSAEQEKRILFRHLLSMTSGLTDGLAFEAEPGTKWRYNTIAYQKIMRALAKAAAKSENELTREWLTGPIGMMHSSWRERPELPGLLGFMTTARDLARFGLLIEANGVWDGKAIVEDREWIGRMTHPTQKLNLGYGYLWWLNGRPAILPGGKTVERLIPSAPDDVVAAWGALGRKVYVAPSLDLVVTRTGDNSDQSGEPSFDDELWKRLIRGIEKK